jgi:methionyl-tRNA synthetase
MLFQVLAKGATMSQPQSRPSAEKFFLTTSIPYVNGKPHVGHALEFVQADMIARYQWMLGKDVYFLTGTDDNSLKNVRAAEKEGISTADLVDRNSQRFVDLARALAVDNDGFIRTHSEKHFRGAQKLWSFCRPEDIYKKTYQGLYCVGCEAYYAEEELAGGKCPTHGVEPEVVEEENYFFRLSAYQERLEQIIAGDEYRIFPEFRKNEVLGFIRGGLRDFSISRSRARARDWGIPVPGDPSQVMYVWFDALSNYVTGLDYGEPGAGTDPANLYTRYWPADAHVIGKDIIRFHAVYWPAMLLSAGLALPRHLFVHGFITFGGAKMAKSSGLVIDPFDLVERYGAEVVRYYLARHIHSFQDSDFLIEATEDGGVRCAGLEEAYNAALANGIGNLASRSLTMIEKNGGATIQPRPCENEPERAVIDKFAEVFAAYEDLMAGYDFSQALNKAWEAVAALDGYINARAPWALAKDPTKVEALKDVLYVLAEGLRMLGSLLWPAMPATAGEIWRRLGLAVTPAQVPWEKQRQWGMLEAGLKVEKGAALFPRR